MDNHTFFDAINTEDKSYWLGFYVADGGMAKTKNTITFNLSRKDIQHLQKLATIFNKPIKLKNIHDKRTGKTYKQCKLSLHSKYLCTSILSLGIPRKKSDIIKTFFIDNIPTSLKHHFIRGYFDGDGSIGKIRKDSNEFRVTICGVHAIADYIRDELIKNCEIPIPNVNSQSNIFRVYFSGTERCNKFSSYLYKDATVFLERKKEIFNFIPPFVGSSQYKYVYFIKSRNAWVARKYENKQMKHIGTYKTEQEAAKALGYCPHKKEKYE